jgi:hypothetical protein
MVASAQPLLPLVIRYEEIKRGRVTHAVHGALPNYAPVMVGSARGTDGTWLGSPIRSGEILRLKKVVVDSFQPGTPERIIAQGLYEYGIVFGDKNTNGDPRNGSGSFPVTMDSRWATGDGNIPALNFSGVRLVDFEVIAQ